MVPRPAGDGTDDRLRSERPDRSPSLFAVPADGDPICEHPVVREFGADGATQFFRCRNCESVLVRASARARTNTDAYRPVDADADHPVEELGTVDPRLGDLLKDIDAYHAGEPTAYGPGRRPSVAARVADACRRLLG